MELVPSPLYQPAFEQTSLQLAASQEFFSTEEAYASLKLKKIGQVQHRLSPNNWELVLVCITIGSLFVSTLGFMSQGEKYAHMNHSQDLVTQFKCQKDPFGWSCIDWHTGTIDSNEMLVDHTKDLYVPNIAKGLITAVPLFFSIPGAFLLALLIERIGLKIINGIYNIGPSMQNKRMDELTISLRTTAEISSKVPTPVSFIPELIQLENLSDAEFQRLSFPQIHVMLKTDPKNFEKIMDGKLSPQQQLYWNKYAKMQNSEPAELEKAIRNSKNSSIFEENPEILEALMQGLQDYQLTEGVKTALKTKLLTLHHLKLTTDETSDLIDDIRVKQRSLDQAYERHLIRQLDKTAMATFEFVNATSKKASVTPAEIEIDEKTLLLTEMNSNEETVTQSAEIALLCHASTVFRNMFQDLDAKQETIPLVDVDPKDFQIVMNYLKTGDLDFDRINYISLLPFTNRYGFLQLHDYIETSLYDKYKTLWDQYGLEKLLELCVTCNLNRVRRAIDLKISADIPSPFSHAFFQTLELTFKFPLPETFKLLCQAIDKDIETWVDDRHFFAYFIKAVKEHKGILKPLFASFARVLETRPKLLAKFWDKALESENDLILDTIVEFSQDLDNYHIILANWDVAPEKPQVEVIII